MHACMLERMHACSRARPVLYAVFTMAVVWRKSAEVAEVAADFPFCHRSNDQDYPEIAPNDADGLVT
jgi:hypothetical protein